MIWLVGLGGSLGAAVRFLLGAMINKRRPQIVHSFPLGTWVINISGSFLLGLLANLHMANRMDEWLWYFAGVGFCGAYTTFSTFGFETITLLQAKDMKMAFIYVATSVALSCSFAVIGLSI